MLMERSNSGLMVPVCLSPTARMQLFLPLTNFSHNIRRWYVHVASAFPLARYYSILFT